MRGRMTAILTNRFIADTPTARGVRVIRTSKNTAKAILLYWPDAVLSRASRPCSRALRPCNRASRPCHRALPAFPLRRSGLAFAGGVFEPFDRPGLVLYHVLDDI